MLIPAAVAVMACGVLVGQRLGERPHPAPASPPAVSAPTADLPMATPAEPSGWQADFAQFQRTLGGQVAVTFAAIGDDTSQPTRLGSLDSGPAWSTMKVPLVIAALRQQDPPSPTVSAQMKAAITESDNAAAEAIWAGLGPPEVAAVKVQDVLRSYGDNTTTVQSQKSRPEYTAFGQTDWSSAEQLKFVAAAYCDHANAGVFDLMGHIEDDQRWGLGTLPGAKFKGGWGPSPTGNYLLRQIGVIPTDSGLTAVVVAAAPTSGTLQDGTRELTAVAEWLDHHRGALPAGQCGPASGTAR